MGVISSITEVFSQMGAWFVTFLNSLIPIFYQTPSGSGESAIEGGLTFFGYLSIAGLAISVFFLVMGLIQNFLHFRG